MAVETKSVANRRQVSYENFDDLLADAESLAGQQVETLGNWSFAQILEHLAISLEGSIDGLPFKAPWPMRVVGKLFLKNKFLNGALPPGFQIPDSARPVVYPDEAITVEASLEHLRRAIARCRNEPGRASHPLLDNLSQDEWDRFSLRHAELHMSFIRPAGG